jgi:hypothetical protein
MSETTRSYHTAEQKVAAVKRHLLDKVPVSQLCEAAFELNSSTARRQ